MWIAAEARRSRGSDIFYEYVYMGNVRKYGYGDRICVWICKYSMNMDVSWKCTRRHARCYTNMREWMRLEYALAVWCTDLCDFSMWQCAVYRGDAAAWICKLCLTTCALCASDMFIWYVVYSIMWLLARTCAAFCVKCARHEYASHL